VPLRTITSPLIPSQPNGCWCEILKQCLNMATTRGEVSHVLAFPGGRCYATYSRDHALEKSLGNLRVTGLGAGLVHFMLIAQGQRFLREPAV